MLVLAKTSRESGKLLSHFFCPPMTEIAVINVIPRTAIRPGEPRRYNLSTTLPSGQTNVVWLIFNTVLFVYPLSEIIRQQTHLPGGLLNLVLLLAVAIMLLVTHIQSRPNAIRPSTWTAAEWCLVLFLGITVLSTLHSITPTLSLIGLPDEYQGLLPWLAYGVLYFWVRRNVPVNQTVRVLTTMAAGSIVPAVYGILQHTQWVPGIGYESRITSLFLNADFCGTYFALMFVGALTLYLNAVNKATAAIYLVVVALNFIALVFSYTRSAWLGSIVTVMLFIPMALHKKPILWKKCLVACILLMVCFTILNTTSHHQVTSRVSTIASNARQLVTHHDVNSVGSDRWYIWAQTLPLIAHHPLLGTGPDTFQAVFNPPIAGFKQYLNSQPMENANNNYIQIAVSQGLPAFIVFLSYLGLTMRTMFSPASTPTGSSTSAAASTNPVLRAGLICAVVGYLIQAVFNIDVITVAPFFWVIFAMAMATSTVKH